MSIPLSRQSRQRANRRSRYQRSSDLPISGYLSVGISDDNGDTPYSSFNGSCRSSRRRSHESTADGSAAVECGTIFSISLSGSSGESFQLWHSILQTNHPNNLIYTNSDIIQSNSNIRLTHSHIQLSNSQIQSSTIDNIIPNEFSPISQFAYIDPYAISILHQFIPNTTQKSG